LLPRRAANPEPKDPTDIAVNKEGIHRAREGVQETSTPEPKDPTDIAVIKEGIHPAREGVEENRSALLHGGDEGEDETASGALNAHIHHVTTTQTKAQLPVTGQLVAMRGGTTTPKE